MSTYTDSLGLEEITPGDQAGLWGNTTNNNLALIDQAIAGVTPVYLDSQSGFTYVLTNYNGAFDEARAAVINVTYASTQATGANIIQIPSAQKLYVFRNSSGQSITVQTVAAAYTVTLANGEATLVFCDGVNAYPGIASSGVGTLTVPYGGTGVTSFGGSPGFVYTAGGTSALGVVTAVNLATAVTGTLPVANGGTGKTSITSGAIVTGNGTGATGELVGSAAGQVPTWNGSAWLPASPASAGVTSFNGRSGTVTLFSSDVTNALGYTPYNSTNPSGFITSSALSPYAPLAGATFTGNVLASGSINLGSTGSPWQTGYFTNGIRNVSNNIGLNMTDGQAALNFGAFTSIYSNGTTAMAFSVSSSSSNEILQLTTTEAVIGGAYTLRSAQNGNANLGTGSFRWNTVYAANGSINTSDRNQKTEIADLDEAEKRVATRIKGLIKKFKFKDSVAQKGADARIHVGVIAQEVGDAFTAEGLDPNKYAMFCYDEWEATEAEYYEDGRLLKPAREAGSAYGIRYDELLAFVISAL